MAELTNPDQGLKYKTHYPDNGVREARMDQINTPSEAECCKPSDQKPRGLVHNSSCSSAAYFDEAAMERAMRRHEERRTAA